MKKKIILLLLFSSSICLYSQTNKPEISISKKCDDGVCTNIKVGVKDLYGNNIYEEDPKKIYDRAKDSYKQKKDNNIPIDGDCDYPRFWFFDNNGNQVVQKAKRNGDITTLFREESCDIRKAMLAIPIIFRGENLVVTSYSGEAVFMDYCFFDLVTKADYWCHGLPAEPTRYHKCEYCNTGYCSQLFKAKIDNKEESIKFINGGRGCNKSKNGNHDDLALEAIPDCRHTKGRTVPTNH